MQGIPRVLSTREDYEYIRSQNLEGWKEAWMHLLEGRFAIHGDDLVEDLGAPLYQLGFSVAGIAAVIEFSGLTSKEREWRQDNPDRWSLVNGEWQEIIGWAEARGIKRLTAAKATKKEEIQAQKRAVRDAGMLVSGVLFDTDGSAQTMYTQFMVGCMLDPAYTVPAWKASGETFVTMSGSLINAIKTAWAELCTRVHKVQSMMLVEVDALTSVEDVEAYDVTLGWDK